MTTGWKHKGAGIFFFCCIALFFVGLSQAQELEDDLFNNDFEENDNQISDPLEPINRVFFHFNDKLYFWVLKPVSQTYAMFLADDVRMCIRNAFNNALAPVRIVNNLLQGKVIDSGTELSRFLINTLMGAGGLGDPARDAFNLNPKIEDLGQTFGKWGVGEGVFICWPILGPSNVRDTVGFVGDAFLNPLTYISFSSDRAGLAVHTGQRVNKTSLAIGDYEQFKESSFDPYTAMRDFYSQSRRSKIADKVRQGDEFSRKVDSKTKKSRHYVLDGFDHRKGEDLKNQPVHSLVNLNNVEKMIGHDMTIGVRKKVANSSHAAVGILESVPRESVKGLIAGLNLGTKTERL